MSNTVDKIYIKGILNVLKFCLVNQKLRNY